MRARFYTFLVLFFALAVLNTSQVKADNDRSNDRKEHDSDKNLPINTAMGALLIAGAGIGIMAIKKAKAANKAI